MKDVLRKIIGQKIINYYHLAGAVLANFVYGFPSHKLHVIGVTGTDGKTTTVNLIAAILKEADLPVSFLSTINAEIGVEKFDTGLHTTTPSPFLFQKLLRKMVDAGSRYAVLEVTSHGLDQFRTWGIRFETAVITNITREHLDYHKTYENYVKAKAKLFKGAAVSILNQDDESFGLLSKLQHQKIITYGLNKTADIWADQIIENLTNTELIVRTGQKDYYSVFLNLPAKFNIYNALAAFCVGIAYNLPVPKIISGLTSLKSVPGRMELYSQGQDFLAMVDFAHTPNALANLLSCLRPKVGGKLIVVFGAAGERDRTKRPSMGEVADKYADLVILTREDNRSEDVMEISRQIASGIKNKILDETYFIIPDRREAIRFGLRQAREKDMVVVTGKGHEQSLNIDGAETDWSDQKVIREELQKLVSSIK